MIQKIISWLHRHFDRDYILFGSIRSPKWSAARSAFIKLHPLCSVCGTKDDCEVHHVRPFHLHPELELDPTNFITLCRPHHYLFGHFMNWSSFNISVREDAEAWALRINNRPAGIKAAIIE